MPLPQDHPSSVSGYPGARWSLGFAVDRAVADVEGEGASGSGTEVGTWASLHHWKEGYVAPRHKHLAGAPACVLSGGKLQVHNSILNAGDYVYEPSGVLHNEEPAALEDATYLFICNGAVLFFRREPALRGTRTGKSWKGGSRRPQPPLMPRAEAAE